MTEAQPLPLSVPRKRRVAERLGQPDPFLLPPIDIASTMSGARHVSGRSQQT
jgi:hypothetical protein